MEGMISVSIICVCCLAPQIGATILRWTNPNVSLATGCSSATLSVQEEMPVGTTVLHLSAESSVAVVQYKLESSSVPGMLQIDSHGHVRTVTSFDYEAVTMVTFAASVVDAEGDKGVVVCTVNVVNVNDNAPVFSKSVASVLIKADIPMGIAVYQAHAVDADGDAVTYAIRAGNSHHTFAIDVHSGEITVASTQFLGEVDIFHLVITAEDGVMPTYTGTATVNIRIHHDRNNIVG